MSDIMDKWFGFDPPPAPPKAEDPDAPVEDIDIESQLSLYKKALKRRKGRRSTKLSGLTGLGIGSGGQGKPSELG